MKVTPCGLTKLDPVYSYNRADMQRNFTQPDKLLATLGQHPSRFFDYNGTDKLAIIGGTLSSQFTLNSFRLIGKGEWYYLLVDVTVVATMPRNGSKSVIQLPLAFGAMHTQKLMSVGTGRGTRGWINQVGGVNLSAISGVDANLAAGERLQLAGWYLPKNDLTTIGIPNIPEKGPFFSEYLTMLNSVDSACSALKTNLPMDSASTAANMIIGKTGLWPVTNEIIYTTNDLNNTYTGSLRFGRFGDFAFIGLILTTGVDITISVTGDIANTLLGNVKDPYRPLVTCPLEGDNTGPLAHAYIATNGDITMSAVGRAGGAGTITMSSGETMSFAGYYRLAGT